MTFTSRWALITWRRRGDRCLARVTTRLPGARDYQIEVSQLTGSDLAAELKPPTVFTQLTGGTASYRWNTPNPGDYWIRYRTKNDCGLSAPSRYEFVQVR